ncbi:Alpha/Beta hydrolase protein [Glomus cerebriforme]|uniref:Alpha/Beta hydrolase protein n=1 Tax=Glomus cerebriforme TaxID=658196 RepID=A0A397T0Y2_9GLOM|nr:Alpha/Beta hydrolase protein [Glomus cerebriforme]
MPVNNHTNFVSVNVIEEWVTRPDGVEIYTKKWMSVIDPPIATVVFLHGFGEHVNRYNHVFDKFALKGVEVLGYDRRGFGQTAVRNKNPGQTGSWKVVIDDITGFLVANRHPNVPQFLFGHSMGGCLAADYASDGPEKNNLAGIVLSSPLIALAPKSRVPKSALVLGNALSKVIPNLTIPVPLDKKYISRDPIEIERYGNDSLIHNSGSLRGLADLINYTKLVLKEKYKNIMLPTYICFGTDDGINDFNTAKQFFNKLPSKEKTWREYPGFYHEMHYEVDRNLVINDYLSWILQRAIPSSSNNNIKISSASESAVSSSPLALASA